jgi:hypothetical protein
MLDQRDKRMQAEAAQKALETAPSGKPVAWTNPDSGHSGTVTPVRTYQSSGTYCREYQQTVTIERGLRPRQRILGGGSEGGRSPPPSVLGGEEASMRARLSASLILVSIAALLAACAGIGPAPPLALVPITDFKMVAGKWGGLVTGISPEHDDWIDMLITPEGTFDFGIYRTVGVFGGKGTLALSEGKLQSRGQRGSATFTLYQGGGRRVLEAQGAVADGRRVSARLSPKD